jgi:uncharacterized repeat protein (TIGR02543 family)
MKKLNLIVFAALVALALAACSTGTSSNPEPTPEPAPAITYTVVFSMDGGDAVASETVTEGSVAAKPADPIKTGYTFKGWYADAEMTSAFDFATTAIVSDTTVYAKWQINRYTVTFVVSLPSRVTTLVQPDSVTADYGATIAVPETITNSNPRISPPELQGWNTDESGFGSWTGTVKKTFTIPANDVKLYAAWL